MSDRPKIGVIGLKGLPAFGGAATVGENLVKKMKGDFEFSVYAVSSHTDKSGFQEDGQYTQIVFRKFFIKKLNIFFYYLKSCFHALFKAKYDLIHLHHIDGAFMLPLLRLKYKVICTSHARPQIAEKWPWYVKFFFSINERIVFWFANHITTVALPLQKVYSKLSKKEVTYIPNGIDIKLEPSGEKSEFDDYILFAAGRIIPLKGLHLLLKALKMNGYKGKLVVLGDLDQMPDYKKEILALSEGLNVDYPGLVKDKNKLLRLIKDSKLFVFPSYSENMSIMLLEVASMKTPLVCSDIPENQAIFSEEETLFFSSNNYEDLAKKIKIAFSDPDKMSKRTEKAYDKLINQFTWERIAKEYTLLFNRFIQN